MQEKIQPIALLGQYEDNNKLYPAAKILNENQDVVFDPVFVAGSIVSLYEAFLSHVPESKRLSADTAGVALRLATDGTPPLSAATCSAGLESRLCKKEMTI